MSSVSPSASATATRSTQHYAGAHPDGWLTIHADDEADARAMARRYLGECWSGLYPADDPDGEWHLYPRGELAAMNRPEGADQ